MNAQITFLIVEDNDLDVEKVERGFKRLDVTNDLIRAKDGQEALDILRGTDGRARLEKPYVVLLDLNMPRMNGHEFLVELRNDEELKATTVVILTTSDNEKDIKEAYDQHVAGYLVKPISMGNMIDTLGKLEGFLTLCKYPQNGTG